MSLSEIQRKEREMTREEAIKVLSSYDVNGVWADVDGKPYNAEEQAEAFDMAIEALQTPPISQRSMYQAGYRQGREEALKREPSEDGTLEVKVEDATKVGRVLISDDKHRGGLYYPDEDEPKGEPMKTTDYCDICKRDMCEFCVADNSNPYCVPSHYEIKHDEPQKGDLISRAEAIEAIELVDWYHQNSNKDIVHGANDDEHQAWYKAEDVYKALEAVPSADRPKGEWIHTPNGIDRDFVWWVCSECGHKIFSETEKDRIEFHAYCGRCGAEMRSE